MNNNLKLQLQCNGHKYPFDAGPYIVQVFSNVILQIHN